MHLYRPTFTRPIPDHATTVTIAGTPHARWVGRGGVKITGKICSTNPKRCTFTSDCWWLSYTDHTGQKCVEKCFPDRIASERRMHDVHEQLRRIAAGDITPAAALRNNRSVEELIDVWGEAQRQAELTEKQVRENLSRVNRVRRGLNATRLTDFHTQAVSKLLRDWRTTKVKFSPQTSNHYLTSLKAFVAWCVKVGFVEGNPLKDAEKIECDSRRVFRRRALTVAEVKTLLEATATHKIHRCPLSGADRAALYMTAIYTGFRVAELASFTRASFRLADDPPSIELLARHAKNRTGVVQPIPADIAAQLASWLASIPPGKPVWPGYAWRNGKVRMLLYRDLAHAKIPRETDEGRIDFHALRTTYITMLARSGVSLQFAQLLARHADPATTTGHYTRLGISDLGEQMKKLPKLGA